MAAVGGTYGSLRGAYKEIRAHFGAARAHTNLSNFGNVTLSSNFHTKSSYHEDVIFLITITCIYILDCIIQICRGSYTKSGKYASRDGNMVEKLKYYCKTWRGANYKDYLPWSSKSENPKFCLYFHWSRIYRCKGYHSKSHSGSNNSKLWGWNIKISRSLANEGLFFGSSCISAFIFKRKMLVPTPLVNRSLSHLLCQIHCAIFPTKYASTSFVYKCLFCTCSNDVLELGGP
jgi:hypothetical protein